MKLGKEWLGFLNTDTPEKKPRKKPVRTETLIQQPFISWFRNKYPHLTNVSYSIPNEGKRGWKERNRIAAEGLTKGMLDWNLAVSNKEYVTLYLEFKSKTGTTSKEQKAVIADLRKYGHKVEVVRDTEAAKEIVKEYLRNDILTC